MPEPASENLPYTELPTELLGNQEARGSNQAVPRAQDAEQLEAAPPLDKLLSDGNAGIPVNMGAEYAGFSGPEGLHTPHSEDVGPKIMTAVQSNEVVSEESQQPCGSKQHEGLEGVNSAMAKHALSCDEPATKLAADSGVPELSSKPHNVLPSMVSQDETAETVHTVQVAHNLADSCQIDLPVSAQPTRYDDHGRNSQAVAEIPGTAQTRVDPTGATDTPAAGAAEAEAMLDPTTSATFSPHRTPADGSGDTDVQLRELSTEQQQVPTTPDEANVYRSTTGGSETVQAELPPLSSGDQAEPAAAPAKEDMDILGNGKLVKKVIKAGKGSHTRPQYGSQVTITYQGQLPNGAIVDQAAELSFILHDGDVIAALDLAVALMELGEECQLQTAPDYAYKGIGRHPDIPPDTPMTYTIELLSVSEPPTVSELPIEQIIALADKKRDRGNYLYSRTEYDSAVICYSRAVQIADDPDIRSEDTQKLQMLLDLRLKCYNNLAATQVKAKQYEAAVESCEKVLKIQPLNVKALFRKGKSLGAMGSTKEAIEILKQALKLEPSTKVIHRELYKLQEKLKKDAEDEKTLYKKMMGLKNVASGSAASGSQGGSKQQSSRAATYGIVGAVAAVALSVGVFMLRKYL